MGLGEFYDPQVLAVRGVYVSEVAKNQEHLVRLRPASNRADTSNIDDKFREELGRVKTEVPSRSRRESLLGGSYPDWVLHASSRI